MSDDGGAHEEATWEVVGGCGRGGILVRSGREISSSQLAERLSTGALVRGFEHESEGRMRYELLSGAGPASGWVSTSLRGKALLVRTTKRPPPAAAPAQGALGGGAQACSAEELEASLPVLRWYSEQLELGRSTAHQVEKPGGPAESERRQQPAAQSKPSVGLPAPKAIEAPDPSAEAEASLADGLMMPVGKTGGMMKILPLRQPMAPIPEADGSCATGCQSRSPPQAPHHAKVALQGSRRSKQQQPGPAAGQHQFLRPAETKGVGGTVSAAVYDGPEPSEQPEQEEAGEVEPARGGPAGGEGACCPRCRLPIGDWGYLSADKEGDLMHSECRAQLLLELAQRDDKARGARDAELKRAHREAHSIGWSAQRAPANESVAQALRCCEAARGPCCLVREGPSRAVRVVPTVDAATAVNLEYLALALQVRRREGREPLFSLDPVDAAGAEGPKDLTQRKRFEPAWLAGTSVGEVMFQADYHLKELSMGEHPQPVVGMRSCLDLAEEESFRREWRAREWFVVKQAGVYLSDGHVLTPHVRMGVEAREQIRGPKGIMDARLTRRDHPLVRYAEAFTRNFDLIAERKSVIYHLRELAKASVLAKYLIDDKAELEEAWFDSALAGEARDAGPAEVPQLWNERSHSRIRLRDGRLLDAERGVSTSTHGVYGGVAFQLEEVPTMQAARLPRAGATVTARQLALAGGGKARSFGEIPGAPKGVDLNLDGFDLSSPVPLPPRAGAAPPGADGPPAAEAAAACGKAFWLNLTCGSSSVFATEDRSFFRALFNPHLSDRQKDGERFSLPQTGFGYMHGLRKLVEKEEELREQRRKHFLGRDFLEDHAGSLFPGSWDSSIAIAREHSRRSSSATARGEGWLPSGATAANMQLMLKTAAPVFDKCTEDGTQFRIYRIGSLEVRTIRRHDDKETIGVVFSTTADLQARSATPERRAKDDEKITKVTEYVESVKGAAPARPGSALPCHYFAVLATEANNVIVAERAADGAVSWAENPEGLEARCAEARVTGCSDARSAGVTLADLAAPRAEGAWPGAAAGSEARSYTRGCLELALPAGQKGWRALAASQRRAAARLGVETEEGWDRRAAPVWRSSWWDLPEQQRSAAQTLGMTDDTWDDIAQKAPADQAEAIEEG